MLAGSHALSGMCESLFLIFYSTSIKKISIPYPEFYVLYDGADPYPDKETLRLSDLFENPKDLGLPEKSHPLLELEVQVLNINEGRNSEIINRCKKLSEYSLFMAKVREYKEKYDDLLKAIKEALKYCMEHDILKEYLEKHETEASDYARVACD